MDTNQTIILSIAILSVVATIWIGAHYGSKRSSSIEDILYRSNETTPPPQQVWYYSETKTPHTYTSSKKPNVSKKTDTKDEDAQ